MLRREWFKAEGYDCRNNECKHHPKGDHGIHCDEWIYAIHAEDNRTALSLTVNTGKYPASAQRPNKAPWGTDVSLHASFPSEKEHLRESWHGMACSFVAACSFVDPPHCETHSSSCLKADELWKQFGNDAQIEQSEQFWAALEALFWAWNDKARTTWHEIQKWSRCPRCDGQGIVKKEIP